LTAINAAVALARAKTVDWNAAIPLLTVATLVALLGAWIP
jgi:uncharacterized membrane protein YfcA